MKLPDDVNVNPDQVLSPGESETTPEERQHRLREPARESDANRLHGQATAR